MWMLSSGSTALLSTPMRKLLPTLHKWVALSNIPPFSTPSLQSPHSSLWFLPRTLTLLLLPLNSHVPTYPVQNPGLHTKRLATLLPIPHPSSSFCDGRHPLPLVHINMWTTDTYTQASTGQKGADHLKESLICRIPEGYTKIKSGKLCDRAEIPERQASAALVTVLN